MSGLSTLKNDVPGFIPFAGLAGKRCLNTYYNPAQNVLPAIPAGFFTLVINLQQLKRLSQLIFYISFCFSLSAQQGDREIRISELFKERSISIFKMANNNANLSLFDTIKASFILINDFDRDTAIYYSEGYNDWYSFQAAPLTINSPVIQQLSGRTYYGKIPYDFVYYAAQKLYLKAGTSYNCLVQWKGCGYINADTSSQLLTAEQFFVNMEKERKARYTNHIITYFFTGAICFGFFLFLFLYYKSRYPLFGLYAIFLFLQAIYGLIRLDVYTIVGSMFITHFKWDEYINELIIFAGQAIYVQFVIGWLKIRKTSIRLAGVFNILSIFFAVYAISFFVIYTIVPNWPFLIQLQIGVRLLGIIFQFFLFYNILFIIKASGRWYIFAGNLLLMFMGVIMVFIHERGGLLNTGLENVDNGSWYMMGVLGESICFTMGLGQHYFQLQNEKNTLQIENLKARQLQSEAEENNLKDRLRISQDLHDNIGSTLSSISVYSQVAQIHGGKNEKEDLNELLEKISSTSNEMVSEMNDIVWAINPSNDSMEKIIRQMESFARPLATARNIMFDLRVDKSIASLQLDMDKRKNFYLIFKEAVNNAIKYSGASELMADIHLADNKLVLQVNDNGVGFNAEKEMSGYSASLSGNGLRNMQTRATELNGKLTIVSQAGKSTSITLHLPLT